MDLLTHFPSKNIYNDVLCINISKVTALNVFQILIVSCALKHHAGWTFHECIKRRAR